jgi:hypothetical protein
MSHRFASHALHLPGRIRRHRVRWTRLAVLLALLGVA